jgi:hypothetical protein
VLEGCSSDVPWDERGGIETEQSDAPKLEVRPLPTKR